MFLLALLHVFSGRALFLGFVDEGVASSAVGGVSKPVDLYLGSPLFVLQEGVGEVPAC